MASNKLRDWHVGVKGKQRNNIHCLANRDAILDGNCLHHF